MRSALKRWRDARTSMAKSRTYKNAVALQSATRAVDAARRKFLKVIKGGKT